MGSVWRVFLHGFCSVTDMMHVFTCKKHPKTINCFGMAPGLQEKARRERAKRSRRDSRRATVGMGTAGYLAAIRPCWLISWGIMVDDDWNHGILNDFPETVGNGSSNTIIFQRGGSITNQISWGNILANILRNNPRTGESLETCQDLME